MVFEVSSYRTYLREVLTTRTSSNPAYSVRALARRLGISPTYLSEVLRGVKNLSPEGGMKVAQKLGLPPREAEYFCLLIQFETSKDPGYRASLLEKMREFRPDGEVHMLDVDIFKAIADWYHVAILELTFVEGVDFSPRALARRLGISELEARSALERLQRLELLEKAEDGRLRKVNNRLLVSPAKPSQAVNEYNRQLLQMLMQRLDAAKFPERISATEMVPLSAGQAGKLRDVIEQCAKEAVELARDPNPKDCVYALSIHAFKIESQKESLK